MKRLFIADKISKLRDPQVLKLFKENDCGIITRTYTSYLFNYPHNLKYKDLPLTKKNPEYKYHQSKAIEQKHYEVEKTNKKENSFHIEDLLCKNKTLKESSELQNLRIITNSKISGEKLYSDKELNFARNKVLRFIDSFDEIIIINDSTLSGVRAVLQYFEEYLGVENFIHTEFAKKITHFFPFFNVEETYSQRKIISADEYYLNKIESYKKKDYFSYNFNTNSIIIIGDILRSLGCNVTKVFTMRMLQTLLLFKSRIENNETLEISNKLKNEDSCLFNVRLDNYIGDNHTTAAIDEYLIDLGLVSIKANNTYSLTLKAIKFLSLLHPKMKDPKLSLKVGEDLYNSDITLDDFKNKYNKKIELMFKKQKRFSSTRKQM